MNWVTLFFFFFLISSQSSWNTIAFCSNNWDQFILFCCVRWEAHRPKALVEEECRSSVWFSGPSVFSICTLSLHCEWEQAHTWKLGTAYSLLPTFNVTIPSSKIGSLVPTSINKNRRNPGWKAPSSTPGKQQILKSLVSLLSFSNPPSQPL